MSNISFAGGFFAGKERGNLNLPPNSAGKFEIATTLLKLKKDGFVEISYNGMGKTTPGR